MDGLLRWSPGGGHCPGRRRARGLSGLSGLSRACLKPRTLAWWVEKLVDALAKEPVTALRIRQVAGERRARVGLDDESVIVEFGAAGQLLVRSDDPGTPVDGEGHATRAEVCAILAAKSDASEAVLSGRVSVRGPTGAVAAMLHAIEILLDSSARIPLLRELADEFVGSTPPAPASSATAEPARPTEHENPGCPGPAPVRRRRHCLSRLSAERPFHFVAELACSTASFGPFRSSRRAFGPETAKITTESA